MRKFFEAGNASTIKTLAQYFKSTAGSRKWAYAPRFLLMKPRLCR